MNFKEKLQALCDEENVKLLPGVELNEKGDTLIAVMTAFKLGSDQKFTMREGIVPKAGVSQ